MIDLPSQTYLLLGSIFLALSLVVAFVKRRSKRNAEYEKAKQDLDAAVDRRDWNAVDAARRRLHKNR